jgi:hypothetical protein
MALPGRGAPVIMRAWKVAALSCDTEQLRKLVKEREKELEP